MDTWVAPGLPEGDAELEILYTTGKVYQDTSLNHRVPKASLPAGHLSLVRNGGPSGTTISFRWTATPDNSNSAANDYDVCYSVSQIHSLKRKGNRLMVVLSEHGEPTSTLPPFIFESGSPAVKTFLAHLQVNLASLSDQNAPALRPVVDDFNLFVVERKEPSSVASAIAEQIQQKTKKFSEVKWKLLESASEVTHFFRHAVTNVSNSISNSSHSSLADESFVQMNPLRAQSFDGTTSREPSSTIADNCAATSSFTKVAGTADDQLPQTEVSCSVRQDIGGLGTFDVMDRVMPQRSIPQCSRENPVTAEEWSQYFSDDGRMIDWDKEGELRRRIFKGGFCPEIRAAGWKFLFGHVIPRDWQDSESYWDKKSGEYEVMRRQWQSVTPNQMLYNSAFRERVERVAKDVARTDRETAYFRDNGPHIECLGNILCTWCMYNFDLGYVQGMSDMAAVILSVVDNEVDAFWCFVGLMDSEHGAQANFATNQRGMKRQLSDLSTLLRFLDPELMECLERNDCGNMYFTFRWLLVFLKREFSVDDCVTLWESMWAKHLTTKFHLFVCLAIIRDHRDKIMSFEFDAMLQYFTTLASTFDVVHMLESAEGICMELSQRASIPPPIKEFLDTDIWTEVLNEDHIPLIDEDSKSSTAPMKGDFAPDGIAADTVSNHSWVEVGNIKDE